MLLQEIFKLSKVFSQEDFTEYTIVQDINLCLCYRYNLRNDKDVKVNQTLCFYFMGTFDLLFKTVFLNQKNQSHRLTFKKNYKRQPFLDVRIVEYSWVIKERELNSSNLQLIEDQLNEVLLKENLETFLHRKELITQLQDLQLRYL